MRIWVKYRAVNIKAKRRNWLCLLQIYIKTMDFFLQTKTPPFFCIYTFYVPPQYSADVKIIINTYGVSILRESRFKLLFCAVHVINLYEMKSFSKKHFFKVLRITIQRLKINIKKKLQWKHTPVKLFENAYFFYIFFKWTHIIFTKVLPMYSQTLHDDLANFKIFSMPMYISQKYFNQNIPPAMHWNR